MWTKFKKFIGRTSFKTFLFLLRFKFMNALIVALINRIPGALGTYTYARVVKIIARNLAAQTGVNPGILGADLVALCDGSDITVLPEADVLQALDDIISELLLQMNVALTFDEVKPLVGIWADKLVEDFPVVPAVVV